MNHVSEGQLQAFLDDALPPDQREAVHAHLAGCAACGAERRSLRDVASTFSTAVSLLDAPVPATTAADVRARAATLPRSAEPARRAWLRAAMIVLAIGATGAVAALPGSPARQWAITIWQHAVDRIGSDRGTQTPAHVPIAEPDPAPAVPATPVGFAVEPAAGRVRIQLRGLSPETSVRVQLVDGEMASVRATGSAATARFGTGAGRIQVTGGGPGEVVIELPRAARSATVEVDGRPFILKSDGRLRFTAPGRDTSGEELRFRIGQ